MNCTPGDLAIMISSQNPENIGCMVEVLSPSNMVGWWRVRLLGPAVSAVGYRAKAGETGLVPDINLRPIRGPRKPDEVTTDRTIDEGVTA